MDPWLIPTNKHNAGHGDGEAFIRESLNNETDECIEWSFSRGTGGYGQATVDGQKIAAHRATCILAHGPPPFEGAQAAHYKCGNSGCINKRHLRWSTIELNHDDKRRHDTMTRGERHPRAAFTKDEVLAIANDNRSLIVVARERGVSKTAIKSIRDGRTWGWLTGIQRKAA